MPAGWTGVSDVPRAGASPEIVQRRAERRAEQKLARRSRQRWAVVWLDGPQVTLSSSEVRDRLVAGDAVEGLVPERVIRCIRRRGLYAVG